MTEKNILPLAAMERLLKIAQEDIRVSDSAKEALRDALENYAKAIAKDSAQYALHAGRKTIKAEDIKLATRGK